MKNNRGCEISRIPYLWFRISIQMKQIIFTALLVLGIQWSNAQEKFNAYNPEADAKEDIENAVAEAHSDNKHVLLQIGGNWCGWCKLFHELTTTDEDLKAYIEQNFEVVHVNYSKENPNLEILKQLEYPQRFGFPVFVILNAEGERIHTQSSGYLEEGKGHSKKLVLEFLQAWSPGALNPENYEN